MLIPRFTEDFLAKEREKARNSLYYFAVGILGFDKFTTDFHLPLCNKLQGLEGHWTRALICGFRGSFKTSVTKAYDLWVLLYYRNTSVLLVENRYENASDHLDEMQQLMRENGMFLEMYRHRIPSDFSGWNQGQIVFNRDDPLAPVSMRVAGVGSRLEGVHVDIVHCNDLEGADVNKSDVPPEDAAKFVFSRARPLLKDPKRSRILVEGTPHGQKPLVWAIRRMETTTNWKECKRWKIWWKPVHDENRVPAFPELYGEKEINDLYAEAERSTAAKSMLEQQYLLRETSLSGGAFDMVQVMGQSWAWEIKGRIVRYPAWIEDKRDLDPETLQPTMKMKSRVCDMRDMRYYVHGDPKHRKREDLRYNNDKSQAGIVVVGITPDGHALVMETWVNLDGGLSSFAKKYIDLYCKWRALKVSIEMTGAQVWFREHIDALEARGQTYTARPNPWDPTGRVLPRMSSRLVEAHKETKSKEFYIMEQLETWHNACLLHIHDSQSELIEQHRVFPTLTAPLDLLDALAQGPAIWQVPIGREDQLYRQRKMLTQDAMRYREPKTGYTRPWSGSVN